jgi:hypothetical protein
MHSTNQMLNFMNTPSENENYKRQTIFINAFPSVTIVWELVFAFVMKVVLLFLLRPNRLHQCVRYMLEKLLVFFQHYSRFMTLIWVMLILPWIPS